MDLEYIINTTSRMEVGQKLIISRYELKELGGYNFLTGETVIDRIKSNIIGSATQFRFTCDLRTGDFIIDRIRSDGKRRHVDHDRRHLYHEPVEGIFMRRELNA